ncbi:MAG: glycine cleavage T C-terminal barrel domain-containing protein, partial [Pseudomonadales bacterium]
QLYGFGTPSHTAAAQDESASTDIYISRTGYTGEDGFEISLPANQCETFVRALLAQHAVQMAGLGARDSLRLEAGLCLYGHDLDESTTPIEAGLGWSIDKSRRSGGDRAGGFPGADIILAQMESGAPSRRIGFIGEGRAPVREGALLVDAAGNTVGTVSSGGFSPSLERPIGMAYVNADALAQVSAAIVRGKQREISRCDMPFVAHRYLRK